MVLNLNANTGTSWGRDICLGSHQETQFEKPPHTSIGFSDLSLLSPDLGAAKHDVGFVHFKRLGM